MEVLIGLGVFGAKFETDELTIQNYPNALELLKLEPYWLAVSQTNSLWGGYRGGSVVRSNPFNWKKNILTHVVSEEKS